MEITAIENEHRERLGRHDNHCIAEATADAFATGHDDDASAWFVAAQLGVAVVLAENRADLAG